MSERGEVNALCHHRALTGAQKRSLLIGFGSELERLDLPFWLLDLSKGYRSSPLMDCALGTSVPGTEREGRIWRSGFCGFLMAFPQH